MTAGSGAVGSDRSSGPLGAEGRKLAGDVPDRFRARLPAASGAYRRAEAMARRVDPDEDQALGLTVSAAGVTVVFEGA